MTRWLRVVPDYAFASPSACILYNGLSIIFCALPCTWFRRRSRTGAMLGLRIFKIVRSLCNLLGLNSF